MRVNFHGLTFETAGVTFYLWSPWRAAALEHRIFTALQNLTGTQGDEGADERRLQVTDAKTWEDALLAMARVLKGWQEEADPAEERRSWRWLLEGDTDNDGFDHAGEPLSLWAFLRASVERATPGEPEKSEDVDLEGFGLRILGKNGTH